ncbi:hypothetical protein C8R30_12723 [Nitrosomonas nitrosa]|uniref:hypothetical protein n=1 Tax=Nitrosomonas nitrosa TaxID=52442 RepID=UPI000D30079E|nr:hypothetical protein [Nitrosomonas nitrosa]PTQ91919.1 hypothetical protein C8R30_12723 [Nitrosomonas nitrosa]
MPKSRGYLYDLFKNNRKPNEDDFKALIDSSVNLQDDRPNAGWYYFRFLPYNNDPGNSFDYNLGVGGTQAPDQVTGRGSPGSRKGGAMGIFIPRGVSRINRLRVVGNSSIRGESQSLYVQLIKSTRSPDQLEVFSNTITITQHSGDQDISYQEIPFQININPSEDALSLRIMMVSASARNNIFINSIGIEFS